MKILQALGGREFRIDEAPIPEPGRGQVRLRVDAVTICTQWDLHLRANSPMFPGHRFTFPYTPGQPGHEASGTVDAVGSGVSDLAVGDRASVWRDPGHDRPGAYAQYVVRGAHDVIRVPAALAPWKTAAVELAMCVGASFLLLRQMDVIRGKRFAVTGLGPAGLIATQMARAEGAREVIGLDLSAERRALAASIGADVTFDPSSDELPVRPAAWIDSGLDCVGAKRSVEYLMDRTRDVVALFGVQREAYLFQPHHYMGLRLCGYPGHSRAAAEYAVGLIERGQLDLSPLVTHHLSLERYAEAIDLLEAQAAVKVCLYPWDSPYGEAV